MRFSLSLVVLAALFAADSTEALQLVKKKHDIPVVHHHKLAQTEKRTKHKNEAKKKETAKEEPKAVEKAKEQAIKKEKTVAAKEEKKEAVKEKKEEAKEGKKAESKTHEKKHKHHKAKAAKGGDKYGQVNEYEADFKSESGGYDTAPVENFGKRENENMPTPLDGEMLTKEIGGATLTAELNDRDNGAGIKDKEDLADLLASVRGAQTFMNKTPKEQL